MIIPAEPETRQCIHAGRDFRDIASVARWVWSKVMNAWSVEKKSMFRENTEVDVANFWISLF